MWLFCISINDVLKHLGDESIEFVAYADDLVIQVKHREQIEPMINHCADLFGEIGLDLNFDKC